MLGVGGSNLCRVFVVFILNITLQVEGDAVTRKLCPHNCLCSDEPSLATCSGLSSEDLKSFATQAGDMEELSVRNSDVRYLKNHTLYGLLSLKVLKITGSRLHGAEENAFQHLRELTKLDLSSNKIEIIGKPESFFDKRFNNAVAFLPNFITSKYLRHVDLSYNNIKYISAEELYGMKFVQHLNLSRNNIPEIRSSYRYLMGVKVLDLSYNCISEIDENFGALQLVLEELHVSRNYIRKFPQCRLLTCVNLKLLDLSFNEISSVSLAGVENCSSLKTLDLESNELMIIKVDDFRAHQELQFLNLANNSITIIPDNTFTSNSKLRTLFVQGNSIHEVTNNTFKGLTSLTLLNLASNDITAIADGAFFDNFRVEYIFLQDNDISFLFPNTFIHLSHLIIINLSRNRLSTPSPRWFLSKSGPYYFDTGQMKVIQQIQASNTTFRLEDNDWLCDCSAKNFLTWSQTQQRVDVRYLPPLLCASPVFHAGKNLLEMDVSDLRCDLLFYLNSFIVFYELFIILVFIVIMASCWFIYRRKFLVKKQAHLL